MKTNSSFNLTKLFNQKSVNLDSLASFVFLGGALVLIAAKVVLPVPQSIYEELQMPDNKMVMEQAESAKSETPSFLLDFYRHLDTATPDLPDQQLHHITQDILNIEDKQEPLSNRERQRALADLLNSIGMGIFFFGSLMAVSLLIPGL